jgi:hypothetical protein
MGEFFAANRIRRPSFVMELNGNKKDPQPYKGTFMRSKS